MKRYIVLLAVVGLVGCSSISSTNTQTFPGTFEAANTRMLQVRMASKGNLNSDKFMPMDLKVKVTIEGKASTVSKLVIGQSISVTQNLDTKRVVNIDAAGK